MGYEIERFVSEINQSLICQICYKVYEVPKMLSQCEHIFCFGCIEQFVITGNHCPIDHKPVESSHVEDAPKAILDYVSALRIKCDFNEYGCKEVVSLNRLLLHRLNCHFHPERRVECDVCGLEAERIQMSEHNCIHVLKNRIDRITQQMDDLKRCHSKEILNLKSQLQRRENVRHNCLGGGGGGAERQMVSFSCISNTETGSHEMIFIQTINMTLQCEASAVTKVGQIKYNASMIANHNTIDFSLFCNGTKLEDNKYLSQYDIRNGTICHLLPNQIFITFNCVDIRQIIGLSVRTSDTIREIIQQLNREIKKIIPEQLYLYLRQCSCSLFFNETKLEETYGLSNYDVFAIKVLKYCN